MNIPIVGLVPLKRRLLANKVRTRAEVKSRALIGNCNLDPHLEMVERAVSRCQPKPKVISGRAAKRERQSSLDLRQIYVAGAPHRGRADNEGRFRIGQKAPNYRAANKRTQRGLGNRCRFAQGFFRRRPFAIFANDHSSHTGEDRGDGGVRGERRGMAGTLSTALIFWNQITGVGIIAGDRGPLPLAPQPRCGPRQSPAAYRGAFVLWRARRQRQSRISCSVASALQPGETVPECPWPALVHGPGVT